MSCFVFNYFLEGSVKHFVVLICGVLLSVQGFAFKGVTGKVGNGARQLKQLLRNQPFIQKLAAINGETSVAINSRNLGVKILSAAVGAGMVLVVNAADANIEKRAKEIDKKVGSAKIIEAGDGVELDYNGRIGGSYSNSTGKPDTLSFGGELGVTLSQKLSSLGVKGSFLSTRIKSLGDDDYSGAEDWIGRATFVRGIPTASDYWNPILYLDGGFNYFGDKKQAADGTGGIGFINSGTLFGKNVQMQLRFGFGWLGEGVYDMNTEDYADIEGNTVGVFGATIETKWTSFGDAVKAEEGSVLYYIPLLPAAVTKYDQYRPIGDDANFGDVTHRVESTVNFFAALNGLGATFKYDGTKGQEAAKSVQVTYSRGF